MATKLVLGVMGFAPVGGVAVAWGTLLLIKGFGQRASAGSWHTGTDGVTGICPVGE
jgi:hypothetical protein